MAGVISGTPSGAVGTSGSFTVVATSTTSPATRSCVGNATYTYAIKSDCAVVLAAAAPTLGIVGSPYTHTFVATGGVGATYAFSIAGALPAGLVFDANSGVLSGILGGRNYVIRHLRSLRSCISHTAL